MSDREKDIQELCKQVIKATPNVWHSNNGRDNTECPFCSEDIDWAEYDMSKIPHKPNCAYLIAKDLSTNLKDEN